ncbi:lysophospholipid acyltransferase family protein [Longispora albida]|uniref:lysophospholipid acyltransferase family protein n=1 Tax=Longispora albida TaxID=203523 RepID=UPI0003775ABD|nr:lysophospholipid acyltransferase family protein [Longispora albida]
MLVEDSVTDMDMVTSNARLFELLYQHLPLDDVLSMFETLNDWEIRNTVAHRINRNAVSVHDIVKSVPQLSSTAEQIAAEWARFRITGNAQLYALMAQLERKERCGLTVGVEGAHHLDAALASGDGVVIVTPHVGLFQAVPLFVASRGAHPTVLANDGGFDDISSVFRATAPVLSTQFTPRKVKDPATLPALARALHAGTPVIMYPEFSMGTSGNAGSLRAPFLGREAWIPTGPARLARLASVDILPIATRLVGRREVVFDIQPPLKSDAVADDPRAASLKIFSWLEQTILSDPHLWWCWPMLTSTMTVTSDS